MGNNGIYGAANIDRSFMWGISFIEKGQTEGKIPQDNYNLILFEFNINFDNDIKICYIARNKEWVDYDIKLDEEYDIIIGEDFNEVKITTKSYDKKTKKNKYITLKNKYYYTKNLEKEIEEYFKINYITSDKIEIPNGGKKYKLQKYTPVPTPVQTQVPTQVSTQVPPFLKKYLKYKQKYLELKKNI